MVWLLNSQRMKNCKSTESFCLSKVTIYTNDWFTFWHVYCYHVYFLSVKFLNLCKPRATFYLLWRAGTLGLAFYGSGLACLQRWLGMVNAGWLGSMRPEIFLHMKFTIFKAASPSRLPFYLGHPLHIISSLFSFFCSFHNAILRKMLRLWNFKPIFLRM